MTEKKIVVPDGMYRAAEDTIRAKPFGDSLCTSLSGDSRWPGLYYVLRAALLWLSENPIVPTVEEAKKLRDVAREVDESYKSPVTCAAASTAIAVLWQQKMFLQHEPQVPTEIKDLLCDPENSIRGYRFGDAADEINDAIIEAYRRGKASK